MENPFKELWKPHHEVPQEIKKEVKNEIAFRLLVSDLANLFTVNYGEAAKSIIENKSTIKTKTNGEV
ncbi:MULTISPECIES: hypothetical protein [unclassified Polaribacter]|uniref:hypothetical protein n=1 Tax=unclassified Polaribacter TaxID=196858 RepID=UPI001408056E|nr:MULTISPECIES: hypothetical protein [unclassified Polaribacter]